MVDISRPHARMIRPVMLVALVCGLGACSSFDSATRSMADAITLYKPEVVQGNFVSKEQVAQLQPGMTRLQVRDVLGTPLMTSVFHGNRWDYVFTMKRQGVPEQHYKLSLFFKDDLLERHEGDEMPSEAEFVQRITRTKKVKVPQLEATEEQLAKFPAPSEGEGAGTGAGSATQEAQPRPAGSYPPLEPQR
ncbi:outer membrane protein assembly factor BamE [Ottowia sp. GY511]|uniref:Outer membrane protein assembly factor BamE n=1 Tax=Ottowia flava TaxID=2675430 RepID=A0ABW4KR43_9BURK|nr:outer membrane protein assembly factor BamE [Ottowia sp. GY511]TXK33049.1 outer membrane protein assembly factor BamE [Ottowia sp. GY511]